MKKSKISNNLQKIWVALIFSAPVALFFSYHPVIPLGSSEQMNFEFSIAEIWLMLFSLVSLINLKDFLKFYGKKLFLFAAFPAYAAFSLLWSPNRLRALLTLGLLSLLIFAALNIYYYLRTHKAKLPLLQKVLVLSAIGFSLFCWLQCILDVFGVSRNLTGLCQGCVYSAFGFPHPNGFAIEPQFAGNLLLVPTLLVIYGLITKKYLFKTPASQAVAALFLTTTVFITFSRGAIYALIIGLGLIFLSQFPVIKHNRKKSNKSAWLIIPIALASFLVALTFQGIFSAVSPTNDTFWSGVTKSIHQLSLGKIDLRPPEVSETKTEEEDNIAPAEPTEDPSEAEASTFSGYVEQSSAFRSQLTKDALDIWNDSLKNLLFGTGLGSAGIKLLEKDPELGIEKEIVQNQYASILLELGLVGFLLIAATIIFIIYQIRPNALLGSTLIALGFTLFFFGGLPNALHVYLFPILLTDPLVQRPRRHK